MKKADAYWEIIHTTDSQFEKSWSKQELIHIASNSEIHLSGWPIGAVLTREDASPKVKNFGIAASIHSRMGEMYDHWELHTNGNFYYMRLLEEHLRGYNGEAPVGRVFHFDTRIRRITEALMHCQKLYELMGAKADAKINIQFNYKGLNDRILACADPGRYISEGYVCKEDVVAIKRSYALELIAGDLRGLVYDIGKETFEYFHWFSFSKKVSDDVIAKFLKEQ